MTVSHSLVKAIDLMLAKGKAVAAAMLEAGEADIAYEKPAASKWSVPIAA